MNKILIILVIVVYFSLGDCLKNHGIFDDEDTMSLMQETNEVRYEELLAGLTKLGSEPCGWSCRFIFAAPAKSLRRPMTIHLHHPNRLPRWQDTCYTPLVR